jgi:hypothetical protein
MPSGLDDRQPKPAVTSPARALSVRGSKDQGARESGPWTLFGHPEMAQHRRMDTTSPPDPVAFLSDFVDVDLPMETVQARFGRGDDWLLPLARRATDQGEGLVMRLAPSSGGRLGVPAKVLLGECSTVEGECLIPVRWEALVASGLFPILDGNLELSRIAVGSCRLRLSATYRPPLHALGAWLDRTILHRVAESTVRSFLHQIGENLLAQEPAPGTQVGSSLVSPRLPYEYPGAGFDAAGPEFST